MKGAIVLFDGHCNFCSGSVRFIFSRDSGGRYRFAALQSEVGRQLLEAAGFEGLEPASLVLIEEGRHFRQSTAALRIARGLDGAWPLAYALIAVPRGLRDILYRAFAQRRYRWFGRTEECFVPTAELRDRFLDCNTRCPQEP